MTVPLAKLWWLRQFGLQLILAVIALCAAIQMAVRYQLLPPIIDSSIGLTNLSGDIAVGYFASWVFNVLVVVVPDQLKRQRLKHWLERRYQAYKDDLIRLYLVIIGEDWDEDLISDLREPLKFADFFNEMHSSHETRWHAVHNGLYEWGLREIGLYSRQFITDCDIAMGMVGQFDHRLMEIASKVRRALSFSIVAQSNYDDVKKLLLILFPLHCPWSVLDGLSTPDYLLAGIQKA